MSSNVDNPLAISNNMFSALENQTGETSPPPAQNTGEDVHMSEDNDQGTNNPHNQSTPAGNGADWITVPVKKNKSRTADDAGLEDSNPYKTPRLDAPAAPGPNIGNNVGVDITVPNTPGSTFTASATIPSFNFGSEAERLFFAQHGFAMIQPGSAPAQHQNIATAPSSSLPSNAPAPVTAAPAPTAVPNVLAPTIPAFAANGAVPAFATNAQVPTANVYTHGPSPYANASAPSPAPGNTQSTTQGAAPTLPPQYAPAAAHAPPQPVPAHPQPQPQPAPVPQPQPVPAAQPQPAPAAQPQPAPAAQPQPAPAAQPQPAPFAQPAQPAQPANVPAQAPVGAGIVGDPAPYPFTASEGRCAAHEQVPRDEFGCSTWPSAHIPRGLPGPETLFVGLTPQQAAAWRNLSPATAILVYPECSDHSDISPAVIRDVMTRYGNKRFPGEPPLQITTATPNPLYGHSFCSKTSLVRGTAAQIAWIKSEVVVSTSKGDLIAVPLDAPEPKHVVTWGGLLFGADRIGEVWYLVANKILLSPEIRAYLAKPTNDLIPGNVVDRPSWLADSIRLEAMDAVEPRTKAPVTWWLVSADLPTSDREELMLFRKTFAKYIWIETTLDGYSIPIPRPFKCSICRSIIHPQGMCPLPAQPEWYGFVPRERIVPTSTEVKEDDDPVIADAAETSNKSSALPKPTMSKTWGDKKKHNGGGGQGKSGGKGKGKGKM